MFVLKHIFAFVFILAFVPKVLCSFGGDKLFKRESFTDSQFNSARSGILGVNGNPTTCEIGLLSPVVGLVAAGCIVTDDNGVKDNSTKYSVYLYMGDQKVDPTIYDLNTENIFIPGTYDKATAHANLAVIRFNGDAKDTYQPHGSLGEYGVAESSYTSRLMDMNLKKWNMASIMGQPNDYFDVCKGINPLYEANSYFLTCNSDTIDSIYNKDCRMPYGAVYTKKGENDDIVLIAIYTHTIVMGTNECTDRRLNFFTYAHNFLPYASWVTGETFNIYKDKNRTTLSVSSEPDMTINAGSSTSFGGMLTVGADLYARYKSVKPSASDKQESTQSSATTSSHSIDDLLSTSSTDSQSESNSSSPSSDSDSSSSPSSSPNSNSGSNSSSSSSSSSKTKTIIGAVVGSVLGLILIAAGVFFYFRKEKKEKADMFPDMFPPEQRMAILEMGTDLVADVPQSQLPPYSQTQLAGSNSRAPNATGESSLYGDSDDEIANEKKSPN